MELVCNAFTDINNVDRIVLNGITYEELVISADNLYEILSSFVLNNGNLFFYCTQKSTCRTFEDTRIYVDNILKKGILKERVNEVLVSLGWDKDNLDIKSTVFSGDLGEYLMSILIEKFIDVSTLISKVSLKTSPKKAAHGNDNIYYDYDKGILYFGESKFYEKTSQALSEAYKSINEHLKENKEFSYIRNHSASFIAENGDKLLKIENLIENVEIKDVIVESISFVMSEDKYTEDEYKKLLLEMEKNKTVDYDYVHKSKIIFLPIISKDKFLQYFEKKVGSVW